MHDISYRGPMPESDYLALVLRIQQAMAIEPFRPDVVDVVKLLADWRTLTTSRKSLAFAACERALQEALAEGDALRVALMDLVEALHVATDDGPTLVGQAEERAIAVLALEQDRQRQPSDEHANLDVELGRREKDDIEHQDQQRQDGADPRAG